MTSLTPTTARRLAITRQHLAGAQPPPTRDGIMAVMRAIRALQIDPIRAVERTQYLVLWSRLGRYQRDHFHQLVYQEKQLFEYWAHAASFVLSQDYPIHQMHMRPFTPTGSKWRQRVAQWMAENQSFRQYVLEEMALHGARRKKEIEDRSVTEWRSGGWTNNRHTSQLLDFMWTQGDILVARREGLTRWWDVQANCLPPNTAQPPLPTVDVVRRAVGHALRALGIATARQINKHFTRNRYPNLQQTLKQMLADGEIQPVTIRNGDETWPGDWFIHRDLLPQLAAIQAGDWQPRTTLLSPFDNLICDRDRTELMWNFRFRIEIYVPAAKRQYGYYVLPILHADRLIGRIDPRMDRKSGILTIHNIYAEPNAPDDLTTAKAIATTITDLAAFLDAKQIKIGKNIPAPWRPAFAHL